MGIDNKINSVMGTTPIDRRRRRYCQLQFEKAKLEDQQNLLLDEIVLLEAFG